MTLKAIKPLTGNFKKIKINPVLDELEKVEKHVRNHRYNDALYLLENLYRMNRSDLHLNLLLGEVHLEIKQYRESKNYFSIANRIDPNNFQALYGLGKVSYLKGDYNKAIDLLEKACLYDPTKAEIYNDLGSVYQEIRDFSKSESCYKHSLHLDSHFNLPVLNLSGLYVEQERYDEALDIISTYFNENEPVIDLLINQGIILEMLNMYQDAIKSFNLVLDKDPKNLKGIYHRGYCYLNLDQLKEARTDLRECLKLDPNAEIIHALLALTYTLEGKLVDTIDVWKEFLPIFKDFRKKDTCSSLPSKIDPIKILDSVELSNNNHSDHKDISVVIPVLNEDSSLLLLYEKLKTVLVEIKKTYEIIFIDDGSSDKSLEILTDISNKDPSVAIVKFRRNYGQTAAFAAGFKYASGDVVITMDADLQNDPADIPALLEKMAEGYDLVSGWRKNRQDKTITRKLPSKIANRIINKLIAGSHIKIHDFGCSLKAYKKGIVKRLKLYGDMHRFIPAYAAWLGIKVAEIPVHHHPRRFGYAKYGMQRIWRVVLDMITLRFYTGFRTHPVLFFGKIATATAITGSTISLLLFTSGKLFHWGITGQTFILMLLFSILGGFQFIVIGLLSEIIMRGFLESQEKEEYVVESIISSTKNV